MQGRSISGDLQVRQRRREAASKSRFLLRATSGMVISGSFFVLMASDQAKLCFCTVGLALIVLITSFLHPKFKRKQNVQMKAHPSTVRMQRIRKSLPWIKNNHYGHDLQVEQLVRAIDRDLALASEGKILGTHLLVGPQGTGKSHLSTLLGQLVFGANRVIEFNFKTLDPKLLELKFLSMISEVNQNPRQLIILDHVEAMEPSLLEPFLEILKTNRWMNPATREITRFSSCLFLCMSDSVAAVNERLYRHCSEIIAWEALHPSAIAEITLQLLSVHWSEHGIDLLHATPKVILEIMKSGKLRAHLGMHSYAKIIRQKSAASLEQALRGRYDRVQVDVNERGEIKMEPYFQNPIRRKTA